MHEISGNIDAMDLDALQLQRLETALEGPFWEAFPPTSVPLQLVEMGLLRKAPDFESPYHMTFEITDLGREVACLRVFCLACGKDSADCTCRFHS